MLKSQRTARESGSPEAKTVRAPEPLGEEFGLGWHSYGGLSHVRLYARGRDFDIEVDAEDNVALWFSVRDGYASIQVAAPRWCFGRARRRRMLAAAWRMQLMFGYLASDFADGRIPKVPLHGVMSYVGVMEASYRASLRSPVAMLLLDAGCQLLPKVHRGEYQEEFAAEIYELATRPRHAQLGYVFRVLRSLPSLRHALSGGR